MNVVTLLTDPEDAPSVTGGFDGSGLPLERALTALADESDSERQRELVAHLRSEVNAGSPFARALGSEVRVYHAVVFADKARPAVADTFFAGLELR